MTPLIDDMTKLPRVFTKSGTITAGNSSGITDGASATVLVSDDEAGRRNLKPLARIMGLCRLGSRSEIMGIGPVPAVQKFSFKGPDEAGPVSS